MRYTGVLCAWLVLIGGGVAATTAVVGAQAPATLAGPEAVTRVLDQYCVTCHNARLKIADLVLDGLDPSDVALNTATWEQVVRKLRQRAMPPAGRPRPEDATSDALATWLETSLDSAAAAAPSPPSGSAPTRPRSPSRHPAPSQHPSQSARSFRPECRVARSSRASQGAAHAGGCPQVTIRGGARRGCPQVTIRGSEEIICVPHHFSAYGAAEGFVLNALQRLHTNPCTLRVA